MISVKNLTRKYGALTAVQSISFDIPKGQIIGLLGHNGAGKTTTLKMLTGYLEPTAGQVTIDGLDITQHTTEVQRKIGYLSEQSPLYPDMTVVQYLEYVGRLRGLTEPNLWHAVKEAIRATELAAKAQELITTLSKGYKQRVGVAQAILHKPSILILDEPTNGLDPTQIQSMRSLIRSLAKTSTIILSTHIMQEVEALCDRVIIILNGRIAIDSPLKALHKASGVSLTLKQPLDTVRQTLGNLPGIGEISMLSQENGLTDYHLEVQGDQEHITPVVAKKVIDQGWALYKIYGEKRNLETVFRDVNRGISGGVHA